MFNHNPLLVIRFDGEAIGPGRIPVSHLLRFLTQFNKALHRSAMVLMGEGDSLRRGPHDKSAKEEIAFDLVKLAEGSPAAVLKFERRKMAEDFIEPDFGMEIIETALKGLAEVQQQGDTMPHGCDAGVLMAWRDAGVLFKQGIREIQFTLNHRDIPLVTKYNTNGFVNIQKRIQGPSINIRTIEGRLLMADFKEHGTRCRVHPSVGEPILCLFDEEQKDEVLENILHYVHIVGEAREDPTSGRITSIKIHDIERLEEKEKEGVDLLPQGSPIPRDFWQSLTIEELALAQNVQLMADVKVLFGTWPGEQNDGFESEIDELRHQSIAGSMIS
jgi:hypothetical protein